MTDLNITPEQLADYIKGLPLEQWVPLREVMYEENAKREYLETAPKIMADMQAKITRYLGEVRGYGAEYRQPQGAHDAYILGDIIKWEDGYMTPTRNGVVHNPEQAPEAWRAATAEELEKITEEDGSVNVPHKKWTVGQEYEKGEIIEYNGVLYRVNQNLTAVAHYLPDAPGMTALYSKIS